MNAASTTRPIAGRSRRRRWLFASLAVLVTLSCIEAAAFLAWWLREGTPFSWAAATKLRHAAVIGAGPVAGDADPAAQQALNPGSVLHPYLGFVSDPERRQSQFPVSSFGLFSDLQPAFERREDTYVIGVLGGSVALQFALYASEPFAKLLRSSPRLAGKTPKILSLALGGYKQPQQLLLTQMLLSLGARFDALINIDGLNEVGLVEENVPSGVAVWFPRGWSTWVEGFGEPARLRLLGRVELLAEERRRSASRADGLWWSPTAQLLWLWSDQRLAAESAQTKASLAVPKSGLPFAATGPGNGSRDVAACRAEMVEVWRRASLQLAQSCAAQQILYLHCLQPNQYFPGTKPMGAAERAIAIADTPQARGIAASYDELLAAGQRLTEAGVFFVDLTRIFATESAPLYVDACCHLGAIGYSIMANHVAAALRARLEGHDPCDVARYRSIAIDAEALRIDDPVLWRDVPIAAVTEDGNAAAVASLRTCLRLVADDPNLIEVRAGQFRARSRGVSKLHIEGLGQRATVSVVAQWPDYFEGQDGFRKDGGAPPALFVRWESAGATLAFSCTGVPAAPFRVLVVASNPLPIAAAGAELLGTETNSLTGTGATCEGVVATRLAGSAPLFLRLYALSAEADVVACSSTVVISPPR